MQIKPYNIIKAMSQSFDVSEPDEKDCRQSLKTKPGDGLFRMLQTNRQRNASREFEVEKTLS